MSNPSQQLNVNLPSSAARMDRAAGAAAVIAAHLGDRAVASVAADRADRPDRPGATDPALSSPQGGDSSSLGSTCNICCREGKRDEFDGSWDYRWWLLKQSKKLLRDDVRLQNCMVTPVPGTPLIELRRDPNNNTAHFRYVEHCNRRWTCPVCAVRMTNIEREELTDGLARAKLLGWHPVMATFTLRHDRSDVLAALVDGLNRARRRMLQARVWRVLKVEYGLKGQIRALEVTWGRVNGWHPHMHILLLLDVRLEQAQIEGLRRWLFDMWHSALEAEGFDASFERGVDVQTADSKIADYVAKWGHEPREQAWGVEHEIANAPAKLAHGDGLTPFQLLEASADDPRAAALFREYAAAMTGRHQIEWSKGLRDALAAVELPAADAAPVALPDYPVVVWQRGSSWYRLCELDLNPKVRQLASIGAADELRVLLRAHGIAAMVYDAPDELAQPGAQAIAVQPAIAAAGLSPGVALPPAIAGAALAPPAVPARQLALPRLSGVHQRVD